MNENNGEWLVTKSDWRSLDTQVDRGQVSSHIPHDVAFLDIRRIQDCPECFASSAENGCTAAPRLLAPANAIEHFSYAQAQQLTGGDLKQVHEFFIHCNGLPPLIQDESGPGKAVQ